MDASHVSSAAKASSDKSNHFLTMHIKLPKKIKIIVDKLIKTTQMLQLRFKVNPMVTRRAKMWRGFKLKDGLKIRKEKLKQNLPRSAVRDTVVLQQR